MTNKEKAERYDALKSAIEFYKEHYERQFAEVKRDLAKPTSENIYAMLTARKYDYVAFLEILERWCKDA